MSIQHPYQYSPKGVHDCSIELAEEFAHSKCSCSHFTCAVARDLNVCGLLQTSERREPSVASSSDISWLLYGMHLSSRLTVSFAGSTLPVAAALLEAGGAARYAGFFATIHRAHRTYIRCQCWRLLCDSDREKLLFVQLCHSHRILHYIIWVAALAQQTGWVLVWESNLCQSFLLCFCYRDTGACVCFQHVLLTMCTQWLLSLQIWQLHCT